MQQRFLGVFTLLVCLSWFQVPGLQAQFTRGALVGGESKIVSRAWHITSHNAGNYLVQRTPGPTLKALNNTIGAQSTFIMESDVDDGDWWTPDRRWFLIRCAYTGLYLTIDNATPGSPVTLAPLDSSVAVRRRQQFRLVSSLESTVGWYKLRSHLSTNGPDLVLEMDATGQMIVNAPIAEVGAPVNPNDPVNPAGPQLFAFNLAMPDDPGLPYVLVGMESGYFLTNDGITSARAITQDRTANHAAIWHLVRQGNGYYHIVNALTQTRLCIPPSFDPSQFLPDTYAETNVLTGPCAEWELIRSGTGFNLKNRLFSRYLNAQSGLNNFVVGHTYYGPQAEDLSFPEYTFILAPIDKDEAIPVADTSYHRIADAPAVAGCSVTFGLGFMRALAERTGLPADPAFFPILCSAVDARYGPGAYQNILPRFDLNDPGHRVDLTLMLRKYLLEVLPGKQTPLTPAESAALASLEQRVGALRVDYADRLQTAWFDFASSNYDPSGGFSTLLDNLEASNFQWPQWHKIIVAKQTFWKQYVSGAAYFHETNPLAARQLSPFVISAVNIGVGVSLQTAVFSGLKVAKFINPFVLQGTLSETAGNTICGVVNGAGGALSVIVTATEILIAELEEQGELRNLQDEVQHMYSWAAAPVNIRNIMLGDDLLAQIRLFDDLDYLMGMPTETGVFQHNTNDNVVQAAFTLACQNNITVELDETGAAYLVPSMLGAAQILFCGGPVYYGLSATGFGCQNLGTHQVVLDAANDISAARCTVSVQVVERLAPTITCPGAVVLTPSDPTTCTAPAPALPASYADNCSAVLSFVCQGATGSSGNGSLPAQQYNSGRTTVTYTATDPSGNSAQCIFTIDVKPCVGGRIIWQRDPAQGIKEVSIAVGGAQNATVMSNANGYYNSIGNDNMTISPSKNTNKLNGINALDVSRLQQHLMGNVLTDPWQLIAADVNANGSINAIDLSILQQGLLGNPSALSQMPKSWRFVPTNHVLSNPPWGFPEQITLSNAVGRQLNQDFYGVKVGDLVAAYANPANAAPSQPLVLHTPDQRLEAGATLVLELSAASTARLLGLQFALHFDPEQLQWLKVEPLNAFPLDNTHFGTHEAANGHIRVVWSAPGAQNLGTAPLFRLYFQVMESGALLNEVLSLEDEILPGRIYRDRGEEASVSLRFDASTAVEGPAHVVTPELTAYPNPFVETVHLTFSLPEAMPVQLRIFDAAGRTVAARALRGVAGQQTASFDIHDHAGLLFAELSGAFGRRATKMLRVQ